MEDGSSEIQYSSKKLAQQYLCLCATSVAAEHVFSCEGHMCQTGELILNQKRLTAYGSEHEKL